MALCGCAPSAEIQDISTATTKERLGQIQKFMLQRTKDGSTVNSITIGTSNPNLLATWTALKSATDNTKVQTSPYVENPAFEAGEAREYGGGNETIGGIPITIGRSPSSFNGEFLDMPQSVIEELKKYECEDGISVFLINECGAIIGLTDDHTTPTTFKGIPVRSFFVSDKMIGGYDSVDKNMVKWMFLPNWSDKLHVVTPSDFEALTQL